MVAAVNLYQDLFGEVSFLNVAQRIKKIQDTSAIVAGSGGFMGGPILSTKRRAGIPVFPQDRNVSLINNRLRDLEKRDDGAVKAHALHGLLRAYCEVNHLTLSPIVFPNGGRVPRLEGTPDEKRVQALKFLEDNLDIKIRELYQGSMFVIEAVPENLKIKQALFEFLAYVLPEDAILATNTSSLSIDEIAENIPHPERVVGIHYFDPADQNQLGEVILGTKTSPEVAVTAYHLLQLEGKKPIICFKDSPLAVANRILVGVLNHAAKLADKGIAPRDLIDEVFLETFYAEQIGVKFEKAQKQFDKAPKLAKFADEAATYKEVEQIEKQAEKLLAKGKFEEREKLLEKKIALLKEAQAELNQKVLYAGITENAARLGTFFETAPSVLRVKELAQERFDIISQYLKAVEENPFLKVKTVEEVTGKKLTPYEIKDISNNRSKQTRKVVKDHLIGAYIGICQKIYEEGIATPSDIALACTEGFQWNYDWNTWAEKIVLESGVDEVNRLLTVVSNFHTKTGISHYYDPPTPEECSGVHTYVQDGILHIVFGKNHVQSLQMTSNSLDPVALKVYYEALLKFKDDPTVHAVFLESKGGKAFGSGANLAYVEKIIDDEKALADFLALGNALIEEIEKYPKQIIAFPDGTSTGGTGEKLAAVKKKNKVYGTVDASIAEPENAVGLFQAWRGVKNFPEILGEELSVPLLCNSQGRKFAWMTADEAYRAGLYSAKPILRSEMVQFKADLISGKIDGVDLRQLPQPSEPQFDKQVEDWDIRKRFNLGRLDRPKKYEHKRSPLAHGVRRLTEKLIRSAHDPAEFQKVVDSVKPEDLVKSLKRVQKWYIHPQLWMAQNKVAARTVEIVQSVAIKAGKLKKTLFG